MSPYEAKTRMLEHFDKLITKYDNRIVHGGRTLIVDTMLKDEIMAHYDQEGWACTYTQFESNDHGFVQLVPKTKV